MINRITNAINSINVIFAKILTYFFNLLLSRFNPMPSIFARSKLLPGISTAYTNQFFVSTFLPNTAIINCFDIKFKFFSFTILLTLL